MFLQQDDTAGCLIGTGKNRAVKEFMMCGIAIVGLHWTMDRTIDSRYYRLAELSIHRADASKAKRLIGWHDRTGFQDLTEINLEAEIRPAPHINTKSRLENLDPARVSRAEQFLGPADRLGGGQDAPQSPLLSLNDLR